MRQWLPLVRAQPRAVPGEARRPDGNRALRLAAVVVVKDRLVGDDEDALLGRRHADQRVRVRLEVVKAPRALLELPPPHAHAVRLHGPSPADRLVQQHEHGLVHRMEELHVEDGELVDAAVDWDAEVDVLVLGGDRDELDEALDRVQGDELAGGIEGDELALLDRPARSVVQVARLDRDDGEGRCIVL